MLRGQGTTLRSWFFPSTSIWVQWIEFLSLGKCLCLLSHLTNQYFYFSKENAQGSVSRSGKQIPHYEQVWLTLSALESIPQVFPFSGARTWVLQGSNLQTGTSWLSRQLSFESVDECSSWTVSIHTGMHQLRLLMTRREFTILNATDHCEWNHSCDWESLTLRVSSETRDISEQGPPHPFHLGCEGAKKFPRPWLFQVQASGEKKCLNDQGSF